MERESGLVRIVGVQLRARRAYMADIDVAPVPITSAGPGFIECSFKRSFIALVSVLST